MTFLITLKRYLSFIGWTAAAITFAAVVAPIYLNIQVPFIPVVDHFGENATFNAVLDKASIIVNYFFGSFTILFLAAIFIASKTKDERIDIKRGASLESVANVRKKILKQLKKNKEKYRLTMGTEKLIIGYTEEVRNFLFLGKAGSGKTQAIFSILLGNMSSSNLKKQKKISEGIADFKEPIIVYERKGDDFVGCLYERGNPNHHLFDPRDKDTLLWNIFDDLLDENGEIDEAMVDYYTNSLQPVGDGKDSHFQKQAQAVVKAILLKIAGSENPSNKALI